MESSSLERPTSRPIVPTVLSNLWQKAKPARPGVMCPSTPRKLGEPVDAEARFDGRGAGWCVYGPDSAHRPTVRGGRAFVLYLLPQGAIEFTGQ